jgi:predicted lipoprotein with Yx(FWY)xxD motif
MNPWPVGDVYLLGGGRRVVGKHRRRGPVGWLELRLRVAGAMLLAASASIHLYLYLTGYRSIPTIGWLFLMQFIVGYVLTAAVLVTRSRIAAAASAAFALSTISAYLLAVWGGLFGFREIRTRAGIAAGLIEVAAFGVLVMAAIAAGPPQEAHESLSPAARMLARVQAAVSMVIGGVGVVSVLALALLGVGLANAGGSAAAAVRATQVVLKTADIGGVTVLTNGQGLTLYWFAPDTPTTSKCTGSCASYWPPVYGSPEAGPGVTGLLGTIRRPDGSVQATYDGHPLYTYVGDSAGQATGNNLDLNGGLWYEVRMSGLGAPPNPDTG